jgi:hypothetical protein
MPKKDRNRQNIDVDSRLQEFIRNLADELSVTESQLWNFFVAEGMQRVKDGTSGLWERLRDGRGIRYKKRIDYEDYFDD